MGASAKGTTIDRRLAAPEAVSRAANNFLLIVIRFITPGVQAGEATFATALGQRFTRKPAETEDDFIDRVHEFSEANRPAGQRGVRAFLDDEFEQ
jgi:hypothetical protein